MKIGSGQRGRGLSSKAAAAMAAAPEALPGASGFTFGCDPELFVFNKEGKPVPAIMIPGSKAEPHVVPCGAVQRDGFAAEFNIDAVTNFEDWDRNIATVLVHLQKFLPEDHTLRAVSAVNFPDHIFADAPEEVKELGCSPDYNAWTGEVNPPPNDPENPTMRCAAGHIHFGWGEGLDIGDLQHLTNCRDLVKQMDWFLGAWSVLKDKDPTRRRLYGKAGAMRPKSYGVEYRVLSNFWVMTRESRLEVWNRMQIAIGDMQRNFIPEQTIPLNNAKIVQIINETQRNPIMEASFPYPLTTTDRDYGRGAMHRYRTPRPIMIDPFMNVIAPGGI